MAIPAKRDLDVARKAINDWLVAQRPDDGALTISELASPGGTGFSNETLLLDATWSKGNTTRTESLVVRVKPTGYRVFLEDEFETQYRVIKALGESGQVKVAPILAYEADPTVLGAPFFVMPKIEGVAPADAPPYNQEGFLVDMVPAMRERLWLSAVEALSSVHRVDYQKLGLDFLSKPERGATGLDQQLKYYEEAFVWAAEDRRQPVAEAAWEWLNAHPLDNPPTELSWGDSRIGNMLFHEAEVQAVLDWEMVSLGGREMDLGWWLFLDRFHTDGYGLKRLPGFGTREDTVVEWESRTGLRATNLQYYEIFAGFRFAVVMIRLARMAIEWGMPAGDMETNNPVTHVLAGLLDIEPPGPNLLAT
jgi:aminoglycoside phosphotransferase (APT) family kinase protein